MLQRNFKKSLGLLLVGILVSTGASVYPSPMLNQSLAPVNQNQKNTFQLTPKQKEQAKNLVETLDLVISFLEENEFQQNVHPLKDKPLEDHPVFSGSNRVKTDDSRNSLLPEFLFYNLFGLKNLQQLRDDLQAALDKDLVLSRDLPIELEIPSGLYRFSRLSRSLLNGSGLIDNLRLQSFYLKNPKANREVTVLNNYTDQEENQGLGLFRLNGEKAKQAAEAVFVKNTSADFDIKKELLDQSTSAVKLTNAIWKFSDSITRGHRDGDATLRRQMLTLAVEYETWDSRFWTTHDLLKELLDEKEGKPLKEELSEITNEIRKFHIILGSRDGEEISFFNLAALAPSQSEEVLVGVTHLTLNLPRLLQQTERPARNIISWIVYTLSDKDKPLPGPHVVSLSQTLESFPAEVFNDTFVFSNLLKILTMASKTKSSDMNDPSAHFGEKLRLNILRTLQKANPFWLKDSLRFLDDETTFEVEVEFLAATGWIDPDVEWKLKKRKSNLELISKVKELVSSGRVATAGTLWGEETNLDTLSAPEETLGFLTHYRRIQYWPLERSLKTPWERLALFNFIKYKLFFTKEQFTETTARLAFLEPETFNRLTKQAKTVQDLPPVLSQELERQHVLNRLNALYLTYFVSSEHGLEDAPRFFNQVKTLFPIGDPLFLEGQKDNFQWVLHFLSDFLDVHNVRHVMYRLFAYYIYKHLDRHLSVLTSGVIFADLKEELFFSRLSEEKRRDPNTTRHLRKDAQKVLSFPKLEAETRRIRTQYPTPEALRKAFDEEEELQQLKFVINSEVFLSKYASRFKTKGSLSFDPIPGFVYNIVEGYVIQAYSRAEEKVKQPLREAIHEESPLMELWDNRGRRVDQFYIEFENAFKNDPFLEEIGRQLNISNMISRAKEVSVDEIDSDGEPLTKRLKGKLQKEKHRYKVMRQLHERGLFKGINTLKRFIELPPNTEPPFFPRKIGKLTDQLNHFFTTESHAFLDESL